MSDERAKHEDRDDLAAAAAGDRTRPRAGTRAPHRSEILREALRRYIAVAERDCMIPVEDALPEEIEDHTCRHSPAVPAAATTLHPLPLLDIAEFELVRC